MQDRVCIATPIFILLKSLTMSLMNINHIFIQVTDDDKAEKTTADFTFSVNTIFILMHRLLTQSTTWGKMHSPVTIRPTH